MTGPATAGGPAVISLPDLWDVSRHRHQLPDPIAAWSTSQAALSDVGPRHRRLVEELIPTYWSGTSADAYLRRSAGVTELHSALCGSTGLVATQFQELDAHLRETERALDRMWRRITQRVAARRNTSQSTVEFLVHTDAQVQLVRQAVRDAQLVRRASSEFVRICRERIETATTELTRLVETDPTRPK